MAKKKRTSSDTDSVDFESAMKEVEQIVMKLESGEAGLTESLEFYERGIKRLKQCHKLLHQAERRVTLLSGFDADGNPVGEDFEQDDAESLTDKQKARSGRRSGGGKTRARKSASKGSSERVVGDSSVDDMPGLF
ncbi:MAG: exodeoxyribonuclease VII small subunit [Pirellulaceae bacterium]|nr:exodeoxyribonuclease VII small subunit [Pirellulaceae bacterium]